MEIGKAYKVKAIPHYWSSAARTLEGATIRCIEIKDNTVTFEIKPPYLYNGKNNFRVSEEGIGEALLEEVDCDKSKHL